MAKSKSKSKKSRPNKSPANRVPRAMSQALDAEALCWARLLNDPCSAPLCHPVYAGADGGILTRFETYYDVGTGATDTAGVFSFTPNAIGVQAGLGPAISFFNAANAGVVTALANPTNSSQPGYDFLVANATAVRCVASCIQVFYNGTEANRSGVIAYGNLSGGTALVGTSTNVNSFLPVLEHYERTPLNHLEIKWRPTTMDQAWRDPAQTLSPNDIARLGAVGFAFTGLAAAAGLKVRLVAIYEYIPDSSKGITNTTTSRNTTRNSLDQVINYLDTFGNWMTRTAGGLDRVYNGAARLSPYVRAVAYAGKRFPAMLM